MTPSAATDDIAIRDVLDRLNKTWMFQRGNEMSVALTGCFAEDVVMRGSDFVFLGRGRDFAVQSYCDFVTQAEVKSFSPEPPQIDISADMAVAQYKWTMTYVLAGQEYTENGARSVHPPST